MPVPAILMNKPGVARVGEYYTATGDKVNIKRKDLLQWAEAFALMSARGVNVPVYANHDRAKPLGRVRALTVNDEELDAIFEFASFEAAEEAKRFAFSSIGQRETYKDGLGNDYANVLDHIAMTAEPVIPAQAPIEDVVLLSLAAPKQQLSHPPPKKPQEATMFADKIGQILATALGEDYDEIDEATAMKLARKLDKSYNELSTKLAKHDDEKKLSLDPALAVEMTGHVEANLDKAVAGGTLEPQHKATLLSILCGTAEKPNGFNLSIAQGKEIGINGAVALEVAKVLAVNKPVQTGTNTGAQLSRVANPAASASVDEETPDQFAKKVMSA